MNFYMVYLEGQSSPTKKYEDVEAAKLEAARLAVKQSTRAFVLQAVASCEPAINVIWK